MTLILASWQVCAERLVQQLVYDHYKITDVVALLNLRISYNEASGRS